MSTVISIDSTSTQRLPHLGASRSVPAEQIGAIATACALLLEKLGKVRPRVELLKVTPWHSYGKPNIFDVKAILSMSGEGPIKIEALETFEMSSWKIQDQGDWDLEELRTMIVEKMHYQIYLSIKNRMFTLSRMRDNWDQLAGEFSHKETS